MEAIHGVDVSWLHHSQKGNNLSAMAASEPKCRGTWTYILNIDHEVQKLPAASMKPAYLNGEQVLSNPEERQSPKDVSESANGNHLHSHHSLQSHFHRPETLHSTASEKSSSQFQPPAKSSKDSKSGFSGSPGRRNSWMSSISSKFSSTSNSTSTGSHPSRNPTIPKNPNSQTTETIPPGALVSSDAKDTQKLDSSPASQVHSLKSAQPSFLQSALRRFSSSSPGSLGKLVGSGVVCERKVMNIDPFRERCQVPDLQPVKLRKVAFCVDVEIAPPAKYAEEEDEGEEGQLPHSMSQSAAHSQLDDQAEIRSGKEQKMGKGEGEALKYSNHLAGHKDNADIPRAAEKDAQSSTGQDSSGSTNSKTKNPTKKKEKKKRSEDERKDRKEQKRKEALANGRAPVELQREGSSSSATELLPGTEPAPKPQDRPTTDPLRIYRRCCQLRETPILRRITEQIGAPSACPVATPGVISIIDLSNYQMQLPDIITLSDYLAIVPVKKLILEGCGLGDEAVRVILAGLLASKTPTQAKYNRRLGKTIVGESKERKEQLGVVEKLSFKNNPKIGREGWLHIAYFINMSNSVKALELSMIPIPSTNMSSSTGRSQSSAKTSADIPALLQQALAGRRGTRLEELVMAECDLTEDSIKKIVDGVMRCGITRLGLANNAINLQGLTYILKYLRTGKCEGLDLGGNDLRESLHLLATALDKNNPLYALSLADCRLSTSSLEQVLPTLVQLPNFRFIDLSHNHDLFNTKPSAVGLLRRYIPQFPIIKRIHLLDVDLSPESAIALAEVLPESKSLAHLNILENKPISHLASAQDEASQEVACALYASLMVATRVSGTIICIDIDVPDESSSEVVKAMAKQIVAYSLRNLERTPLTDPALKNRTSGAVNTLAAEKEVAVPDVLMHLVGHVDGVSENHDSDDPAPDEDYIVGGTGVVKALDVCLSRATDAQKTFPGANAGGSGTVTPKQASDVDNTSRGRAKEMSKDLLGSARKIRARLLPALVNEAKCGDEMSYSEFKRRIGHDLILNDP